MKHGRSALLACLVAVFALACGLGLWGCSAGGKQQTKDAGALQEVASDKTTEEAPGDAELPEVQVADEADDGQADEEQAPAQDGQAGVLDEAGEYTSKDEVAWYLHTYGHLPSNYVTKDEAEDAGWKTQGLTLWEACPGKSIGGDRFGNREGRLPNAAGRTWYECDIDYAGEPKRNAKRIVYSNDGLIYYTEDHYETFVQLY